MKELARKTGSDGKEETGGGRKAQGNENLNVKSFTI